jgi:hypothetical protein
MHGVGAVTLSDAVSSLCCKSHAACSHHLYLLKLLLFFEVASLGAARMQRTHLCPPWPQRPEAAKTESQEEDNRNVDLICYSWMDERAIAQSTLEDVLLCYDFFQCRISCVLVSTPRTCS